MPPHTVVLIGDVGVGKSTLVERVTGITGISSDASESCTTESCIYVTPCRRMLIIDTPGSNATANAVEHNIWIAHALNYAPVSLILIMAKADPRIDNTVSSVRKYAEGLQDLSDLLGYCVTHMDTVSWTSAACLGRMTAELGMTTAVFVGKKTPQEKSITDIVFQCKAPKDVRITSDNFPKYFKISNSNLRILGSVREEVARCQTMNRDLVESLRNFRETDRIDLIFEFQAFMSQEIIEAQKRVANAHGFSFVGPGLANEVGHIANLTNQLRAVLFEVRTLALGLASGHGVSGLRRCPHCGLVWAKVTGCDGETVCGNREPSLDARRAAFATFHFVWNGRHLDISRAGNRQVPPRTATAVDRRQQGCGRSINWSHMAPVSVPVEFCESRTVSTDDVNVVPAPAQHAWRDFFDRVSRGCHLTVVQT
eukprot:TRINITY_DN4362_c0_g2_i1.p1 TRINITY_DN4362_c0_g2~~TRINITY_DN4362_c0_g2_i1.p1  ORF type:complete len:462 (-),score=38.16 TRINITY_DN4362_c0_g2_i1:425-1699(-)